MKERKIVSFHHISKSQDNKGCKFLNNFEFKHPANCFLGEKLLEIATLISKNFSDIKYLDHNSEMFLEALKIPPKDSVGDLTGDYGKETIVFLKKCLLSKIIIDVGSMIDVGGRSLAAIHLVRSFLKNEQMPGLILDINILTPFLAQSQKGIFYAIGDAKCFFKSERYK